MGGNHSLSFLTYFLSFHCANIQLLLDYIVRETPVDVANIRHEDHVKTLCEEVMGKKWGVAVIEFTDSYDTSLLSRSIAWANKDKLSVGIVRASNNQLASEFGLGSQPLYPQIVAMCAGENVDNLANLVFTGTRHRKQVDSWLLKHFGTFALRRETCEKLRKKARRERARRKNELKEVSKMSKEVLEKKRVKELRRLAQDMDIATETLIEKSDYVDAIFAHRDSSKVEL